MLLPSLLLGFTSSEVVPRIKNSKTGRKEYVSAITFTCSTKQGANCSKYVYEGFDTYQRSFFTRGAPKSAEQYGKGNVITTIEAVIDSDVGEVSYETDDSYSLSIAPDVVQVAAHSEMGVSRALATFTQMITETEDPTKYTIESGQFSDDTEVHWRHYYVDACSHFMSVDEIKRIIDATSLQKLNILILEIGCGYSINVLIQKEPVEKLANGAFTSVHYYTTDDMRSIQEHGRAMGVIVVPKISMPSRTDAWKYADRDLVACTADNPNQVALNPYNENVYTYIEQLTDGLVEGFFPQYLNIAPLIYFGGDKVVFSCWDQSPTIRERVLKNGGSKKVWQYFQARINKIIATHPSLIPIFNEGAVENENDMPHNAIIHFTYSRNRQLAINKNLASIYSTNMFGHQMHPGGGGHYFYSDIWSDMARQNFNEGCGQSKKCLGGGIIQLSDNCYAKSCEQHGFTRAIAVSEKLWTNMNSGWGGNTRFEKLGCKLQALGIYHGPLEIGAPCAGYPEH